MYLLRGELEVKCETLCVCDLFLIESSTVFLALSPHKYMRADFCGLCRNRPWATAVAPERTFGRSSAVAKGRPRGEGEICEPSDVSWQFNDWLVCQGYVNELEESQARAFSSLAAFCTGLRVIDTVRRPAARACYLMLCPADHLRSKCCCRFSPQH